MLETELESGIAVVRMNNGKVNVMDLEFCRQLADEMERLSKELECKAAVLVGNDRVFSAGVDLKRLIESGPSYLDEFLPALGNCFASIFRFPKPIVAAINGHAIAGGCIMATACDHRLIQPRARIGLPELRVGVPLPSIAIEIMRFAVDHKAFQSMVLVGQNYRDEEAVKVGLADRIVQTEFLLEQSIQIAKELMRIPADVYALSKRQLRLPVEQRLASANANFQQNIGELWHSEEIQAEIRQYVTDRL